MNFKTDYFFPPMARYLGYIITLIGIIGIPKTGLTALAICIVGLGISFTRYGVLIDSEQNKLKEYLSVFWIKFGKWGSLKNYPYLTVLKVIEKHTMLSRANVEHTNKNLVCRITLLNENHYVKILLKQSKGEIEAEKQAEDIAQKLNIEKVIYSPGYK